MGLVGEANHLAHDGMITAIDQWDSYLVTSSFDKVVKRWDIRMLMSGQGGVGKVGHVATGEMPVLGLACCGSAELLGANTPMGLYTIDFAQPTPGMQPAGAFADNVSGGIYSDVQWCAPRQTLIAGGEAMRVEIYTLV